ncbi:MAG: alpha/beta hydrolase family protein [Armatimonadota bacterium]|nr:alpha/beta hydrolase family protein [Armatimonadota bacterium]MDW8103392.1 alpha/beta hydrolase family protein [Armatimonadota bacterium]
MGTTKRLLCVLCCLWCAELATAQAVLEDLFRYPPRAVEVEVVREVSVRENTHLLIRFPSLVQTKEYPPNSTVYAEVFLPHQDGKMPAVVILHSWGVQKPDIELALARHLSRRGFVTAVMTLPYHVQRTPSGYLSGELMIVPDVKQMRDTMRQAALDTMRLIDWLQSQPQVEHGKIGIVGISLGAIVSALVLGVETRLQAGVLILGGANLAHILWRSPLTMNIRAELRSKGVSYERLRQEMASVEPLNYLHGQHGEKVLMVNGRYDLVIPREDAAALRRALGEGPILWLNTGHYGPALVRPALFRLVERFLNTTLRDGAEPFSLPRTLNEPTIRIGLLHSGVWGTRVSAALDLWQWEQEGRAGVALQLSPRNISLLVGVRPLAPLHVGVEISSRAPAGYVLFHFVL